MSAAPESFPAGWKRDRIGDLFDSWGGLTPAKSHTDYWGPGVPWVSSGDVKSDRLRGTVHSVTSLALQETRLRVCPPGSVLVVVRSGVLAHSLPVTVTDMPVVINQDLKAFHSAEPLMNEWLALFLRLKAPELLASSRRDGTTVQSVRYPLLKDALLPVPPLAERERLIAAVQQALNVRTATSFPLGEASSALRSFRQSVLAAACSGRLTEGWRSHGAPFPSEEPSAVESDAVRLPLGWSTVNVGELVREVQAGKSFAVLPRPAGLDEWGIVKVSSMSWGSFRPEENKAVPSGKRIDARHEIKECDLLFSRSNTTELVGAVVLVGAVRPRLLLSDKSLRLVVREGALKSWLVLALSAPQARRQLQSLATGTSQSMKNISQRNLLRVLLPLPPLEEQQEIVRRVTALLARADELAASVDAAARHLERTSRSVLVKAFQGELVGEAALQGQSS